MAVFFKKRDQKPASERENKEMNSYLKSSLDYNLKELSKCFGSSFDIVIRRITSINGIRMAIIYIDGLTNKDHIHDNIIKPCIEIKFRIDKNQDKIVDIEDFKEYLLSAGDIKGEKCIGTLVQKCLCGDTLLLADGSKEALIIQTRKWQSRGVPEPKTQQTVRGPGEGFTETLLFNTALLRRKIKSTDLTMEVMQVGTITRTDVAVAYMKGIADEDLVKRVKQRLQEVDADYILESGHIEQLIEDNKRSLFATIGNNEKPDVVAAKILKGRVAIIVDGTPFVLSVPMLFVENFQAPEDYYARPYYSNVLRVLRVIAYLTTLLLPGFYVALTTFHQEMIPSKLLLTLVRASEGVPLPSALEMFLMLILYDLLREALLRLPTPVGSTVGIVGVLIIGEAAVTAGIIGSPVVVIAAMTFITSAVVNSTVDSVSILRIVLLFLGAIFGIFGLLVGMLVILIHLCSIESFGIPYLMPISPISKRGLDDAVVRMSTEKLVKRRKKS